MCILQLFSIFALVLFFFFLSNSSSLKPNRWICAFYFLLQRHHMYEEERQTACGSSQLRTSRFALTMPLQVRIVHVQHVAENRLEGVVREETKSSGGVSH